jgi:hypothetical protein
MTNRRPQIGSQGRSVLRRQYGSKRDEVGKDGITKQENSKFLDISQISGSWN